MIIWKTFNTSKIFNLLKEFNTWKTFNLKRKKTVVIFFTGILFVEIFSSPKQSHTTFWQRIWFGAASLSCYRHLKWPIDKLIFDTMRLVWKKAANNFASLHLQTQPRFQWKRNLMKLRTFFISKARQNYTKPLTVFERTLKI